MKPKKLPLKEMFQLYSIIRPYVVEKQTQEELLVEFLSDGMGERVYKMFYSNEYPDNPFNQTVLIDMAFDENNVMAFLFFISEMTNGGR
jgi:hypothetical protein